QDDHQQPRVATFRAREPWRVGPGKECTGSEQQLAAARSMQRHGVTFHAFVGKSVGSSALKLRRHEKERERLWPAFRTRDGLARFRRSDWTECFLQNFARVRLLGHSPCELVGKIE